MDVTIYTSYGWGPCILTKDWLIKNNISYKEERVDNLADTTARDTLLKMGFRSTPVVIAGTEVVIGYNTKKLSEVFSK